MLKAIELYNSLIKAKATALSLLQTEIIRLNI